MRMIIRYFSTNVKMMEPQKKKHTAFFLATHRTSFFGFFLILLFLHTHPLQMQENPAKQFVVREGYQTILSAGIDSGYEHFDIGESSINLSEEKSGFRVDSLTLSLISQRIGAKLHGLTFALSLDLASAINLRDGCPETGNINCNGNNDYLAILLQANVKFPLASRQRDERGHWITIGLQPSEMSDNFASFWDGHVSDPILQDTEFAAETDFGLSYYYLSRLGSIHLFLANGEGGSYRNADPSAPIPAAEGLSLQGLATITPQSPNKLVSFTIALPFQLDNLIAFRTPRGEVFTTSTPFQQIHSYSLGWSTDLTISQGANRWSAQIGSFFLMVPQFFNTITNNAQARSNGRLDFFQTSYRYQGASIFYRYQENTTFTSDGGLLQAIPQGNVGGKATHNLWGLSFHIPSPGEFTLSLGTDTTLVTYQTAENLGTLLASRTTELFLRMSYEFQYTID